MSKSEEIDAAIEKLYPRARYTELKALSKLFSAAFLDRLADILNQDKVDRPNFSDRYEIQEGWIDKIPLAKFVQPTNDFYGRLIDEKVELGDFLLIYKHQRIDRSKKDSKPVLHSSRAVIIQAKCAKTAQPKVPIDKLSKSKLEPTNKELALLSEWPKFDLYATSQSKQSLLTGIQLNPILSHAKFAGYHNKCWYVGEPQLDAPCNQTLGDLIINLVNGKEGERFLPNDNTSDWNKLINKIIDLCGHYDLPPSLFRAKRKRFGRSSYAYASILGFPVFFSFFFFFFSPQPKFRVIFINRIMEEGISAE